MKSKKPGKSSSQKRSKPEILNMSPFGMWILTENKEYYVDFSRYHWFKEASMGEISNVEAGFGSGIYWPSLDIDVSLEALEYPERFPLVANFEVKRKKEIKKDRAA